MKRKMTFGAVATTLLLIGSIGTSACDSASVESETSADLENSTDELASILVSDLGLTTSEQAQFVSLIASYGDGARGEPGFRWRLAADLQDQLTAEQKQRLFDKAATGAAQGPGHGFRRGQGGAFQPGTQWQGPRQHGFRGAGGLESILTEEQIEQVEAIRESARGELESIRAAVQAGEMTPDEAREQVDAIRESVRTQIEALLTDEQKAELEALRQERQAEREQRQEEAKTVRDEVLGLSSEEADAFDAIVDGIRTSAQELREQVRNQELTREEAHSAMTSLREDKYAQLSSILDETQLEIVKIRDAIGMRMRHHGVRGPHSNGGPSGGVNGGPFGSGFGFGSRG